MQKGQLSMQNPEGSQYLSNGWAARANKASQLASSSSSGIFRTTSYWI
jgi:hypothetical protein